MERVLDVYAREYDAAHPWICLDEKTLQLLADVYEPLEAVPGHDLKVDAEYKRKGTTAIFVITEPATGRCATLVRERRTAVDFAGVLAYIADVMFPEAETITIVLDNLNIHTLASLEKGFSAVKADRIASRLELVHTPVHGSWLNLAENQISIISRQCLTRRIPDVETLRSKMRAWTRQRNSEPHPVKLKFNKETAREKLSHLYPEDQVA